MQNSLHLLHVNLPEAALFLFQRVTENHSEMSHQIQGVQKPHAAGTKCTEQAL